MIGEKHPKVFALKASRAYGEMVAASMGVPLSTHEERSFEDGEHKARPLTSVRGRDVYVVQSLHGGPDDSPNDKLCRLLFFAGAVHDAGARRVTAVIPYLAYARKDRRTKSRDPVTTRYVAQLIEAVGRDKKVVEGRLHFVLPVRIGATAVVSDAELQAFRDILASDPKNVKAATDLANRLYDAGRFAEAIPYYQQAHALDPKNISVSTDEGVVELTGSVKTRAERAKAAQVAAKVEGVKKVNNQLKVVSQ